MHDIVDLTLCAAARRALFRVLEERGIGFFVEPGRRPPRLDARRIAWVVEAARRAGPARPRDADAMVRTRRVLRRVLIRLVAERMVSAGF